VTQLLDLVQDYELCMERVNQLLDSKHKGSEHMKLSEKLKLLLK
jgi:hypothetical protein